MHLYRGLYKIFPFPFLPLNIIQHSSIKKEGRGRGERRNRKITRISHPYELHNVLNALFSYERSFNFTKIFVEDSQLEIIRAKAKLSSKNFSSFSIRENTF